MNKILITFLCLFSLTTFCYSQPSLDGDAMREAKEFFKDKWCHCDDGYYYFKYTIGDSVLYQCKYEPSISIEGTTFKSRQLSEADKLNGVDPLPVAYEGLLSVNLNLCRGQRYSSRDEAGFDSWGLWSDRENKAAWVRFYNIKGKWRFDNNIPSRPNIVPLTCNDIPSKNKVAKDVTPFWEDNSYYGRKLVIPATYGKWFYIGRGPLKISRGDLFTYINLDGTPKKANAGGYNWGTNTDALAPNIALGSIIGKIGENGQPFQVLPILMYQTFPTKDYTVDISDKVYIAINDSDYTDNRGQHVVFVSGESLCFDCVDKPDLPTLRRREPDAQEDQPKSLNCVEKEILLQNGTKKIKKVCTEN